MADREAAIRKSDGSIRPTFLVGGRARAAERNMPFLVLDNQDYPVVDPGTGLICQFETREQAEKFCKEHNARRVMQLPAAPKRQDGLAY